MSYTRGMKVSKTQKAIRESMQLVEHLKLLEEKGALHLDREKREVHLVREIFWDGKDLTWRKNFTANLYFLLERHLDKHTGQPFHIYAINIDTKERAEYITSYLPLEKKCMIIK
ncbi:hypothetical protein PBT90_16800 [Algoriphagus halophytocola]|uniref:hypothetical protein n=1 Tax=Algoriphagus halophytocola TaxID=2991499 RepID=UPI0022DD5196|nr:hypothetical protein [Algoriphagus sp. TR-M9]WBL42397.1 hypothetical protein PBT90_16800 [Algoriphagus sp. TR-M9]